MAVKEGSFRSVHLMGNVGEESISNIIEKIQEFEAEGPQPIKLIISSYGGETYPMIALYDFVQTLRCPIETHGLGYCMSAGAFLLAMGTKGMRFVYPNTIVMVHELSYGNFGSFTDVDITHEHMKRVRRQVNTILASHTNLTFEQLQTVFSRDTYFGAEEAIEYGFADKIISHRTHEII